ncbi:monocarboxylate transporter 12-B-like [Melitaea cinxia]|uniref:monocarboxylate transporter 12-B-like n=1 Tax=Melitaea cinxia TaxID=113334 RepID=UPI001E27293C|nr:monocarboxylate transporter 12-B-like [Melitaea cinxia]
MDSLCLYIAGIGHVNSFGLIYKDFIVETHSNAKLLTTAHGIFSMMLAIGGLIVNILSKRYSLRLGGLIGAILMTTGSFLTIIITNTNQLPFTFGLLQGIGFGMITPVCYATINHYFVRRRTQVMSLIKAIQGIILIWYPQLIKLTLTFYGFRETLLIISGISLHSFPGMVAMVTRNCNKEKTCLLVVDETREKGGKGLESVDLLEEHKTNEISPRASNTSDRKKSITIFGIDLYFHNIFFYRNYLLEILNIRILRDPIFNNICVGLSFVNFSDLMFFMLYPLLLYQYGFDMSEVAVCISINAGADVAGRFGLAFISSAINVNTRLLFFVATFFTMLARIVILQVRQFVWIAVMTSLLGVLRALLHITSPLVISNHVNYQDFTESYALFMLSSGLVNVIFSPLIGLLKDIYRDYIPAFYALTLCCLPCLILWTIEFYMIKVKNKN